MTGPCATGATTPSAWSEELLEQLDARPVELDRWHDRAQLAELIDPADRPGVAELTLWNLGLPSAPWPMPSKDATAYEKRLARRCKLKLSELRKARPGEDLSRESRLDILAGVVAAGALWDPAERLRLLARGLQAARAGLETSNAFEAVLRRHVRGG